MCLLLLICSPETATTSLRKFKEDNNGVRMFAGGHACVHNHARRCVQAYMRPTEDRSRDYAITRPGVCPFERIGVRACLCAAVRACLRAAMRACLLTCSRVHAYERPYMRACMRTCVHTCGYKRVV